MVSLRHALNRLFGRPTGTIIVPAAIDAQTLAALEAGELAPPFLHDAPAPSTCPLGWHLRRVTIAEAHAWMNRASDGRRRAWFRLQRGGRPVTETTRGELFIYGQTLPDGVPAGGVFLCDGCGAPVSYLGRA
jgi:hypothetical protein